MSAVTSRFTSDRIIRYGEVKHLYRYVLQVFGKIKLDKSQKKKMVGIVGEIYVKFSPLGNNQLEAFLLSEGCEPVLPGLMDFCMYSVYNSVIDHELYLSLIHIFGVQRGAVCAHQAGDRGTGHVAADLLLERA